MQISFHIDFFFMSFQVLFLICSILCISFGQQPFTPSSPENGQNYQIKDYSCDESGYIEYLSNWSEEKKSSSRNPSSEEFTQRFQYFIDNEITHEFHDIFV